MCCHMKVFLVGVSCIGKSTIGRELAKDMSYNFYDLDIEIEAYFSKSISQIQSKFIADYSFRKYVLVVLKKIIEENQNFNYIVAMPPSGLQDCYLKEVKKIKRVVIVLNDRPENILKRITFYDYNSNKIEKELTEGEKKHYLREIKKDITYYKRTYKRANYHVNIDGLSVKDSVHKIKELLNNVESLENNEHPIISQL